MREARAGDFVFIPPGIVHWEQNASDTEPVEMVVARSTQEAIVVAVEGIRTGPSTLPERSGDRCPLPVRLVPVPARPARRWARVP